MAAPQASSRLEMLQARFQQRQLLEKEQKLLQLYDQQQLRAHQVAQRGSAGSNGSNSSGNGTSSTVSHHQTVTRTTTSTHSNSNSPAGGKVRQMFDERRQTTVKGIDKSYPLEPLDNRARKQTTTTSNVVTTSTSPLKNGNPTSNRQSLVVRRTVRSEANSNVNGGKPIVSYHEEVSRESCGPTERDEPEEFGDDDNREYANGNRQIDERSEVQIEDVTNENTAQRHRVTAKIHIGEYDDGNRVGDDLENEQFPEDFVIDDRLPRRAPPPKKPSQAEARLERFKNSNPKRPGQIAKAGNTTSYTKKRIETSVNSGSTSRASTVTRTELEEDEEEETSRRRSGSPTPEVERTGSTGRPRSPTPEERARKLTFPVVDRSSIVVARSSGVSKVSQLTHKNSMDFYPRRKSEFEKSKTFRKLQLELGESSPEPAEPEDETPVRPVKQCKKRSSILVDDVYNPGGRRSSSSSPMTDPGRREKSPGYSPPRGSSESPVGKTTETREANTSSSVEYFSRRKSSTSSLTDRNTFEERRTSREMSPGRPPSRKLSESPINPVYERKSTVKREEKMSADGKRHSTTVESNFFSSRRRSSSTRATDVAKGRRVSREKSPERPQSRRGSESPVHGRKSSLRSEENKTTSSRTKTTGQVSSIYSSQRRSSSSSPAPGRDPQTERRCSREKTPERPQSRRGSESPVHGRKSSLRSEENKTTSSRTKTTGQVSSIYSSQRRSSSSSPAPGRDPQTERRCSREKTPERPQSRRGSVSPTFGRRSSLRNEESIKITEIKTGRESDVYLSRRRSSSATPTFGEVPQGRKNSREMSPERPPSRRGSGSPVFRRTSIVADEETRSTRKRSESPRRDSRTNVDSRRTSGGTLRSVELVKKISPGSEKKSTKKSLDIKTTLEDVDFARPKSRSKSPAHRVVKKDKAVLENKSRIVNENARRNSNEPKAKAPRSRTVSPSPPPSSSMRETASSRAKKAERRDSSERRSESRYHHEERKVHEINRTNLSHEKARNCDLTNVVRSSSPEDKSASQSRRSSADVTVKRHDTFKVKKPSERIIKIERETSVDDDDDIPIGKPIAKDQSELLERIEKIRTTLSKTGKSEQNLHESKDFERTDSVESALRRFDSIGVETEHHVTVGVDEIDRKSACPSPEPLRRSKEIGKEGKTTKKSVDTRSKSGKITVAVAKVQPRRIEPKSQKPATTKSVRAKEKSATKTSQKIATSLVQRSKLRGEESSGRGEGRLTDRSPECKRRLFEDSESEIETDNSRSTVVMSTMTTMTKSPGFVEIEARKNRDNLKIGSEIRSESIVRAEQEPTKILRSIEDIRKSIKRESQDFNRELNIFNTAMRRDEEMTSSVTSSIPDDAIVTSGIVSCVKITKTQGPDDVEPVVKIERSTVKLPITRHRVAKSPSPDIGTKRSTDGRARTPTASVRRSVPSSPAKSPDAAARYGSADIRSAGPRRSTRSSASPSSTRITEDCTDGPGDYSELTITETTTRRNDAFVVELDDDDVPRGKENASSSQGKPPLRKQSTEKSLTSQKTQRSPNATPLPRPASALSTSSTGSARGQSSQINSKTRMSTKTKTPAPNAPKRPSEGARASTAAPANDGLAPCKICGRRFNSDRITLHEQICSKTATKKRKQFDATIHRVKGTELESFVVKKGGAKKGPADRKTSKPEVKSNWRRKHEDFINAIRSAKQMQAHLAAGGKLSDLPPPPPSDTSDYIQCPHCGRKFNQGAAERHIPKCQNMMHNKPNPRAPPKPKR